MAKGCKFPRNRDPHKRRAHVHTKWSQKMWDLWNSFLCNALNVYCCTFYDVCCWKRAQVNSIFLRKNKVRIWTKRIQHKRVNFCLCEWINFKNGEQGNDKHLLKCWCVPEFSMTTIAFIHELLPTFLFSNFSNSKVAEMGAMTYASGHVCQ